MRSTRCILTSVTLALSMGGCASGPAVRHAETPAPSKPPPAQAPLQPEGELVFEANRLLDAGNVNEALALLGDARERNPELDKLRMQGVPLAPQ